MRRNRKDDEGLESGQCAWQQSAPPASSQQRFELRYADTRYRTTLHEIPKAELGVMLAAVLLQTLKLVCPP